MHTVYEKRLQQPTGSTISQTCPLFPQSILSLQLTPGLHILNLLPIARHTLPLSLDPLARNRAPPPLSDLPRLLRLIVADEQLAVLSVAPRHLARDFDDVEGTFEA